MQPRSEFSPDTLANLQRLVIAPEQFGAGVVQLLAEQQHYLRRVLRLRAGECFIAMDGRGQWWLAQLGEIPDRADLLHPIALSNELPFSLTLAVAIPKGSGLEEVLRQATELGVTTIVPLLTERTLVNPGSQKQERWQRIVQEAAEQSERQVVPTLLPPQPWNEFLQAGNPEAQQAYLCVTRQSVPHLLTCLEDLNPDSATSMIVATGPEGGWTEAELDWAIGAGYQPVSLGRFILRAVTAPIAALSLISAWGQAGQQ